MPRVLDEERNPIVGALLTTLRSIDLQRDPQRFRGALKRLGWILAYEIARSLQTTAHTCVTPLGTRDEPILAEIPVLATILRASLPMWEGMTSAFPDSPTMVLGASRREGHVDPVTGAIGVDLSYAALTSVEGRTLIYADPMVATGSTLLALHPMVTARAGTPRRVVVAGVIGYRPTAEKLERAWPNTEVILASADDQLDGRGYIIPGLGDAGDLAFGPKL